MTYQEEIINHYNTCWDNKPNIYLWDKGPFDKLLYDFRVLEFAPTTKRNMWTYATCCLTDAEAGNRIELHLFSPKRDESLIELLTVLAYYHQNTTRIGLNDTVNFGRPWQDSSACTHGFVSLPYLDGPKLENMVDGNDLVTKFYWLLPITEKESEFKSKYGVEALEKLFDQPGFNYLNTKRASLA